MLRCGVFPVPGPGPSFPKLLYIPGLPDGPLIGLNREVLTCTAEKKKNQMTISFVQISNKTFVLIQVYNSLDV